MMEQIWPGKQHILRSLILSLTVGAVIIGGYFTGVWYGKHVAACDYGYVSEEHYAACRGIEAWQYGSQRMYTFDEATKLFSGGKKP